MEPLYHTVSSPASSESLTDFRGLIILIPYERWHGKKNFEAPSLTAEQNKAVAEFAQLSKFEAKGGSTFSLDLSPKLRLVVACLPKKLRMFDALGLARACIEPLEKIKCLRAVADLRLISKDAPALADAIIAAAVVAHYDPPKYTAKPSAKKPAEKMRLNVWCTSDQKGAVTVAAKHGEQSAHSTNLVRRLAQMAGNDLNCKAYVQLATKLAKDEKLATEFFPITKLKKMGAGAFVAVNQGSATADSGILKIIYSPKSKAKDKGKVRQIALVGKGLTYDTGGMNIKTSHMYGMHGDMTGSAVALGLVKLASREGWPFGVTAYLAIADNAVGERSYRPNDVITAMNKKTIEVVDTDAEGRMVLADTLVLASREKPDFIMDFATLTGACMRAIGTRYSGAFGNRRTLHRHVIASGNASGERVWPFPVDKDLAECLKSDTADIKQCRPSGGVDHMEASYFLSQFVGKGIPWLHIDLSACENEGGLAHVPTKETGFGIRFAAQFLKNLNL